MAGNIGTSMIITGGLHVEPAEPGKALIGLLTSHFSLYLDEIPPTPPVVVTGGGGPYPGPAWNKVSDIRTFYQKLDPEMHLLTPDQLERFRPRIAVTLRFKIGDYEVEKIFSVAKRFEGQTVKIFRIFNATVNKMRAWITNLRNT